MHFYLAKTLHEGEQELDDTEDKIQLMKVTLDEALNKVNSGEINNIKGVLGVMLLSFMDHRGTL